MTKILLLSDTHGFIDDHILSYCRQADEVWHAGDIGDIHVTDQIKKLKPLRAVYGNIDNQLIRTEFPLDNVFTIEHVKVWITHIGGNPYRYHYRIKEKIKKNTPKLFICGHSHILKIQYDRKLNMLFLNPGAVGNYGIHKIKTMLRFEIKGEHIQNMEVIEMKR